MDRIVGIYKITNKVNGKTYVGQTVNYNKRKRSHVSYLNNGNHSNLYLQRAWNKYGKDSFVFTLICECEIEELDDMECLYIEKYNSLYGNKGYNLLTGGQSYRTFTDDVKKRMSLKRTGVKFSETHRKRISLAQKGKKISIESIKKANITKRKKGVHLGEKNPNATISNKTAEKIIYSLLKNETVKEICEKYDTTSDTVYNIMYNKSFPNVLPEVRDTLVKITKTSQEKKIKKAIELYLNGYSQNKISKELKISRNTLRREFTSRGIDTKLYKNQFTKSC